MWGWPCVLQGITVCVPNSQTLSQWACKRCSVAWNSQKPEREQSEPGEVTGKGKQQTVTEPLTINPKSTLGWKGNGPVLSEMGLPAHYMEFHPGPSHKTKHFKWLALFPLGKRIKSLFGFLYVFATGKINSAKLWFVLFISQACSTHLEEGGNNSHFMGPLCITS